MLCKVSQTMSFEIETWLTETKGRFIKFVFELKLPSSENRELLILWKAGRLVKGADVI